MKYYPKFDERLDSHLTNRRFQQTKARPGTIVSFDKMKNTMVVILDDRVTNQIGNIIKDVPCPSVQGVQMTAPTIGSRCIIGFVDDSERYPYVVSFIDGHDAAGKFIPNYGIETGVPRFLV
jgi:hypothetical protein